MGWEIFGSCCGDLFGEKILVEKFDGKSLWKFFGGKLGRKIGAEIFDIL